MSERSAPWSYLTDLPTPSHTIRAASLLREGGLLRAEHGIVFVVPDLLLGVGVAPPGCEEEAAGGGLDAGLDAELLRIPGAGRLVRKVEWRAGGFIRGIACSACSGAGNYPRLARELGRVANAEFRKLLYPAEEHGVESRSREVEVERNKLSDKLVCDAGELGPSRERPLGWAKLCSARHRLCAASALFGRKMHPGLAALAEDQASSSAGAMLAKLKSLITNREEIRMAIGKQTILARSFFAPTAFSKPESRDIWLQRVRANFAHYRSIYAILFAAVAVYTVLSSPWLLFGLSVIGGAFAYACAQLARDAHHDCGLRAETARENARARTLLLLIIVICGLMRFAPFLFLCLFRAR